MISHVGKKMGSGDGAVGRGNATIRNGLGGNDINGLKPRGLIRSKDPNRSPLRGLMLPTEEGGVVAPRLSAKPVGQSRSDDIARAQGAELGVYPQIVIACD